MPIGRLQFRNITSMTLACHSQCDRILPKSQLMTKHCSTNSTHSIPHVWTWKPSLFLDHSISIITKWNRWQFTLSSYQVCCQSNWHRVTKAVQNDQDTVLPLLNNIKEHIYTHNTGCCIRESPEFLKHIILLQPVQQGASSTCPWNKTQYY